MGMQDCIIFLHLHCILNIIVSSYLPILHYDATPFRSDNTRILKVEMISFKLTPFSSFRMSGVFFSLCRAYLNSIYLRNHTKYGELLAKGLVSLKRYNFLRKHNRNQLFMYFQS